MTISSLTALPSASQRVLRATVSGTWPAKPRVLAVVTRPGQESAELGALLYALSHAGATLTLLTLSRGEASRQNSSLRLLEDIRPRELQIAAGVLGVTSLAVADYPDGRLAGLPPCQLTERVGRAIRASDPDLLLVLDPAGSDQEDVCVAASAVAAAAQAGVPVVARTAPDRADSWQLDLGAHAGQARAAQRAAVAAHASQAETLPVILQRLDGLDGSEHLRWLSLAGLVSPQASRLLGCACASG